MRKGVSSFYDSHTIYKNVKFSCLSVPLKQPRMEEPEEFYLNETAVNHAIYFTTNAECVNGIIRLFV